jgi:hypothetical protein
MKKLLFVYDDIVKPDDSSKNIVGDLRFSEIVYKRKNFKEYMYDFLERLNMDISKVHISNLEDMERLKKSILGYGDHCIVHMFSYSAINNYEVLDILFQKIVYAISNTMISDGGSMLMASFKDISDYRKFLEIRGSSLELETFSGLELLSIENECLYNISDYGTLISFISGGFDARYFNQLKGDEYTVTKISDKKDKIKREYSFYHLLPENMKSSFVLPYDYRESDESASYTMERYNFTDMAIRWIHKAIKIDEFEKFMKKAFRFIESRSARDVSKAQYAAMADRLYVEKLKERIEDLKRHRLYPELARYISVGTEFSDIDEIYKSYCELYEKLSKRKLRWISVIGHGDFCFSNILYDKGTGTMKLIDPKGAMTEEELWTDPYYDIAKLSHSICGLYDFFNNGLYDIKVGQNMKLDLNIDMNSDRYVEIFRRYLEENGYEYELVRLYEASLFLSMLPLHMDNPQKVLGFLLNGILIMEEVKTFV